MSLCGGCGGEYGHSENCPEARAEREAATKRELDDLRAALRMIGRLGGAGGELARATLARWGHRDG